MKMEYATLGTPKKNALGEITNAVVFCHGISGNYSQIQMVKGMFGPGKPFDTDRFFFICPTALGSPGSSCPSVSGLGPRFPKYVVEDMVAAQYLLLTKHLNIKHLAGVTGPSMGGLQTLQWISMYPDFMDWAIAVAAGSASEGRLLARSAVLVDIIKLDPEYKNGHYTEQPKRGMELYFMASYLWYFGNDYYSQQWKSKEALLKGLKDVGLGSAKADANDTIWREEAFMGFDVREQLSKIKARTLVIGINEDEGFPPSSFRALASAIPGGQVFAYDSILGHVGCALELEKASRVITDFLKENK
ncbi:MAG: alpha/beta fold hydrolase [Desulfobacteraceae bacterium]|nr:MAG: alpha/beta fold hydrolase [Desulfobacteraceae bacterium]